MRELIVRKTTGDVWEYTGRKGQWKKIHRGYNTKRTSKPVGYIGYNFYPYSKPGKYRKAELVLSGGVAYYD